MALCGKFYEPTIGGTETAPQYCSLFSALGPEHHGSVQYSSVDLDPGG